jgi:queuine/archaeosine tRNA-ribosyltransferase
MISDEQRSSAKPLAERGDRWMARCKDAMKPKKWQSWEGALHYEVDNTGARDNAKMCNDQGGEFVRLRQHSVSGCDTP